VHSSDFNRIGLKRRLPTEGASRTVRETTAMGQGTTTPQFEAVNCARRPDPISGCAAKALCASRRVPHPIGPNRVVCDRSDRELIALPLAL